jgi:predicted site-specific integrase-resolvase
MHIELPNGDKAIPNAEFADKLGVVVRTLNNYDREGLPYLMIGGKKYRPLNEGLAWIAQRIRRRNPRRTARVVSRPRPQESLTP